MNRKPDFIFLRALDIEQKEGLALAGDLITNIPKSRASAATEGERATVLRVIQKLTEEAQAYRLPPEITSIWIDDAQTSDIDQPIPDRTSLERWKGEYVVTVVRMGFKIGEGVRLN